MYICQATFAYCKHLWGSSQQERAFSQLHNFVKKSLHPRSVQLAAAASPDQEAERQLGETRKLLARLWPAGSEFHISCLNFCLTDILILLQVLPEAGQLAGVSPRPAGDFHPHSTAVLHCCY